MCEKPFDGALASAHVLVNFSGGEEPSFEVKSFFWAGSIIRDFRLKFHRKHIELWKGCERLSGYELD